MSPLSRVLNGTSPPEAGDADQLLPLVYDELRKLAAQRLAHEKPGQTLEPTALVHEAYLRLVGERQGSTAPAWNSRGHFFAAAAEAMRRILIERARHKHSQRHGGRYQRQPLADADVALPEPATDILALNEALERFERIDPIKAELVKLRYFAGLSIPLAAEALDISTTTADRYWAYARAWLHAELKKGDGDTAE